MQLARGLRCFMSGFNPTICTENRDAFGVSQSVLFLSLSTHTRLYPHTCNMPSHTHSVPPLSHTQTPNLLTFFIASTAWNAASFGLLRLGGEVSLAVGSALILPMTLLAFIRPVPLPYLMGRAARAALRKERKARRPPHPRPRFLPLGGRRLGALGATKHEGFHADVAVRHVVTERQPYER